MIKKTLPPHIQKQLKTLVFDLDGVITSERKYWDIARLTLWELLERENYLGVTGYFELNQASNANILQAGETIIPSSLIYTLKNQAINSNWDITYIIACLQIMGILQQLNHSNYKKIITIFNTKQPTLLKLQQTGQLLAQNSHISKNANTILGQFFTDSINFKGGALLDHLVLFIQTAIQNTIQMNTSFFEHKGELWQLCYQNFQDWYEEKKQLTDVTSPQKTTLPASTQDNTYVARHPIAPYPIMPVERLVINASRIERVLAQLQNSGQYTLGIATGRPKAEAVAPLEAVGLLKYFAQAQIVTYDDVIEGEIFLAQLGHTTQLGKPHPYVLLKAMYPTESIETLCTAEFLQKSHRTAAFIGDSASDIVAAKKAGVVSIGVLTGLGKGKATKNTKRKTFIELGCDIILNSILDLPQALGLNPSQKTTKKPNQLESIFQHRTQG